MEKPSILGFGPTPFKRKGNNIHTMTTVKKKKATFISPSVSMSSPTFSSSTLHDTDILGISTSTQIGQPTLSYSPLVRRCTEALQTSMIQHLDSLVKTHMAMAQTPIQDKENVDSK